MGWTIAVAILAVLAVAEAVALLVLRSRLQASRRDAEEMRARLDTRNMLWTGGREAVKTVWQTANLVRTQGFGGAVRSSIEELADWADVERPDLARLAPDGKVVVMFSDIEESTALNERIGDRAWVRLIGSHDRLVRRLVKAARRARRQEPGRRVHGGLRRSGRRGELCRGDAASAGAGRETDAAQQLFGCGSGSTWASRCCRGDDLFGRNVAMAARVAGQADGGEILVSESVRDRGGRSSRPSTTVATPS